MRLRMGLVALLLTSCGDCSDDASSGASIVRVIEDDAQLISGIEPSGRKGDFIFDNGRIRFIVQDVGSATGWGVHGGSLVDIDVVGSSGEGSGDRLQEIFYHCDLRGLRPERAEIVNDGSNGEAAVLRLTGKDGGFPLLDAVLRSSPIGIEATIEYRLEHDSDTIEIVTTAKDILREGPRDIFCGLILLRGDSYQGFVDGRGFDVSGVAQDLDYVAAGAPGASASFVLYPPMGRLTPLAPQSEVLVLSGDVTNLLAADTREDRYLISVGDGSVESALQARSRRLGQTAERGDVRLRLDATSVLQPFLQEAQIEIESPGERTVSAGSVDATGVANFNLPPGTYFYRVRVGDRQVDFGEFTVAAGTSEMEVSGNLGDAGVIRVRGLKVDGTEERPSPLKVTLLNGHNVNPLSAGPRYYVRAEHDIPVVAGDYTLVASRGPEYELYVEEITVSPEAMTEVTAKVRRAVDSTGWVSGDFHVHGAKSMDSGASRRQRVIGAIAEGLDMLIATDHDIVTDYSPIAEALGLSEQLVTVPGTENSPLYGHINAYPIDAAAVETYWGIRWWEYDDDQKFRRSIEPVEVVQKLRDAGAQFVHFNHPREGTGIFGHMQLDPATGETVLEWANPDGFELYNSASDIPELMEDWYGLIRNGRRITAVGVSDSHSEFGLGDARTYIQSSQDDPSMIDTDALWPAMRAGKVFVSSGPFVEFTARRGNSTAELGDIIEGAGPLQFDVTVQAPSWMDVSNLQIIENGNVAIEMTLPKPLDGESLRLQHTFTATPAADSFYILRVEGSPGSRNDPVSGEHPLAITNPIYADVDGGGLTF